MVGRPDGGVALVKNVSVVIPTRGDVPLDGILNSLPRSWEKVIVDNSQEQQDFMVYARYIGCQRASHDLILTQDDDVIISDPEHLVRVWEELGATGPGDNRTNWIVCNMPAEFRHDFYTHHALVGFGAVFHRSIVEPTFQKYLGPHGYMTRLLNREFLRTCDIPFTALNPRVLVDVPKENLPWCNADNRMWTQPTHYTERMGVLDRVRKLA